MSIFPFSAVIGQEIARQALLLGLVCPGLGGVLLTGEKGTAKSTLVRSLNGLSPGSKVTNLPLNATEDRVLGTLNLEKALTEGVRQFEPGLLAEADQGILYIDEVNLLSESLVNSMLDAAESGINLIEREGISYSHPARFLLVGTMNPEEGNLSPQLLDRFGLVVPMSGVQNPEIRKEIIKRRLAFEADPELFRQRFHQNQQDWIDAVRKAKELYPKVAVSGEIESLILETTRQVNTAGHRADLVLSKAVRAAAALAGRSEAVRKDVADTAPLVLYHRARIGPESENEMKSQTSEKQEPPEENQPVPVRDEERERELQAVKISRQMIQDLLGEKIAEEVFEIGEVFQVRDLFQMGVDRRERKLGSGKRSKTRTSSLRGRYIKYRLLRDGEKDIAVDATLRAAAPHQRNRTSDQTAVVIHPADLRRKVREKRIGNTILFLVDASGSMRAQRRMAAAKGAVLSLLQDAYQKRDQVGLMAFRGDTAELLLNPTRSIDLAQKRLERLPTGGRTPLSHGLSKVVELVRSLRLKDPDIRPVVVLVTDGRANFALSKQDPFQEACRIAEKASGMPIRFLVIDTETGPVRLEKAKMVSKALQAEYYPLAEIRAETLADVIRGRL
jgi:magnesium chelatase subunit D